MSKLSLASRSKLRFPLSCDFSHRLRSLAPSLAALTLAVTLAFGGFCSARAQTPALPTPVAASADDFGPSHLDVPFVLLDNWIILDIKLVNDPDALKEAHVLQFLLNTGCTNCSVSQGAFASYKLDVKTPAKKRRDHTYRVLATRRVSQDSCDDLTVAFGDECFEVACRAQ